MGRLAGSTAPSPPPWLPPGGEVWGTARRGLGAWLVRPSPLDSERGEAPPPPAAVGALRGDTGSRRGCEARGRKRRRHRSAAPEGDGKGAGLRQEGCRFTAPLAGPRGQPSYRSVGRGALLRGQGGAGCSRHPRLLTAARSSGTQSGPGAQPGDGSRCPHVARQSSLCNHPWL